MNAPTTDANANANVAIDVIVISAAMVNATVHNYINAPLKYCAISIASKDVGVWYVRWKKLSNCTGILYAKFDDTLNDLNNNKPITPQQGAEIAEFINRQIKKGCNHIVCQCEAGISRSAGVAEAICSYFQLTNTNYQRNQYKYCPNRLVSGTVYKALKNA